MSISVEDIQTKKFSGKMRGYNPDEVNTFLDQIIDEMKDLETRNHELEETVKSDQEKLKYFSELKDSLNQSILVAQEAADKVKSNAQRESDITLREAQKQATDIVAEANDKANQVVHEAAESTSKLTVETNDLKKQTMVFRQRLQVMLESQLEVVRSNDWDTLLKEVDVSSFDEIQKVLGQTLDNSVNQSVNSSTSVPAQSAASATSEVAPAPTESAPDAGQTVVIFPDDSEK
ncbi:DivIVA domain-containing protein [Paucilactobacillus nenjiangensis]|jgi:cell division initiation protein|uniref:DivIVA domain-containing protein n=1 Tax=Paucilactobacillus nenjiangensis TaxID=1296540 RepID=A0A5P1X5H9_9LACO|nr:DivIVA domain-containing protein [Paucilactobacillus nenjiangensis]QER67751.1 DivIVA domain-containing protein [Paucilactobacillus nenjiangensis]